MCFNNGFLSIVLRGILEQKFQSVWRKQEHYVNKNRRFFYDSMENIVDGKRSLQWERIILLINFFKKNNYNFINYQTSLVFKYLASIEFSVIT